MIWRQRKKDVELTGEIRYICFCRSGKALTRSAALVWRPAGEPSGHFAVSMDRYASPPKKDFKLYPRWPQLCGFGCDWHAGVESEFDRLTDEEKTALTVLERNAVGGKIEASK